MSSSPAAGQSPNPAILPSLSSSAESLAAQDSRSGFRLSLIAHAAFAGVLLLKALVFPSQPVLYVPSLRVDLVGLPDVLKKDLARIPKSPGSEKINDVLKKAAEEAKQVKDTAAKKNDVETKPEDMVLHPKAASPKDREKKLKSALDRIKALTRVQNETDNKEDSHESPIVKGNKVSPGTSLTGDAKETAEAGYLDQLRDRLQENWELPVWISRQNLSAQVWLYIDSRGRIRNLRFERTSGNPQFDEAVKKAIQDSQPFPVPPSGISGSVVSNGVLVGFPL